MQKERFVIDISDLNRKNSENIYKFVDNSEKAYNEQIREIANQIIAQDKKIVLVTGPSSAGKTTSSYKIRDELKRQGKNTFVINMDDFFKDLDTVPLMEDGEPAMEDIVALDVDMVNKCLSDIVQNKKTYLPQFDFATHKRKKDFVEYYPKNYDVIIMEGIHALNPLCYKNIDERKIFKIYVHCNTDFVYNKKIILKARQLRLLRRLVRDELTRHTPIEETLSLWEKVCAGEEKNIRPFKQNADFFLNSTHFYEPLLYKDVLLEKLEKINKQKYIEIVKIILETFRLLSIVDKAFVPNDSLVREFIGE